MENEFCPIADFFGEACAVKVIKDGEESFYTSGSEEFSAIVRAVGEMFADARQMPAFGVSIDKLTREEMQKGVWTEFLYDAERTCWNMPFASLLFAVKDEYRGVNVVRKTEEKYQGRCFYVDLGEKDMSAFAAALAKIGK